MSDDWNYTRAIMSINPESIAVSRALDISARTEYSISESATARIFDVFYEKRKKNTYSVERVPASKKTLLENYARFVANGEQTKTVARTLHVDM